MKYKSVCYTRIVVCYYKYANLRLVIINVAICLKQQSDVNLVRQRVSCIKVPPVFIHNGSDAQERLECTFA